MTPKKDSERNLFKAMENHGYIKLISTQKVYSEYDPRFGGNISKYFHEKVSDYPEDFNVIIATKTY